MQLWNKKATKRALLFLAFTFLLSALYTVNCQYYAYISHLNTIEQMFEAYIDANGSFPENQNDLIEAGFLKFVDGNYRTCCDPEDNSPYWYYCPIWQDLQIAYGINHNNVCLKDDQLDNLETNTTISIISGPYQFLFKDVYTDISVRLYDHLSNVEGVSAHGETFPKKQIS